MTTISRTAQVSHSSVTSGGGGGTGGDWDHRLNNLLHDLQESVVPEEQRRGASEYREYRMTTSSRHNDEPASTTEEKWVELGTRDGQGYERTPITSFGGAGATSSSSSSRRFESSSEKTVGFTDSGRSYGIDSGLTTGRSPQIEYLAPSNTTTILKSGPSSPLGGGDPDTKVDRKEFYSKASYTTLLKGGPDGGYVPVSDTGRDRDRILEELLPPRDFPPLQPAITSSTSESRESRREVMESRGGGTTTSGGYRCPAADLLAKQQQQTYTATPLRSSQMSSSQYSKESTTSTMRAITPPPRPIEGLKTPPMVRKILQESTSAHTHTTKPPPSGTPIPIQHTPFYDESTRSGTQYYHARTTRTETRERDASPVRRFPSPTPQRHEYYGEPPKHLDELLATFDESYTHTSRITGDGGGPHKSHPYGPGTHRVRIDDRVQSRNIIDSETELVQRKTNGTVDRSHPVSGPPVFYPPGQMFNRMEEEGKGQSKAKMERKFKGKESSKQKHSEKGGEGAVPVPVCLPVCCAAPCVVQ